MNPNTFQEALKATARIACCAGLVSIVACRTEPPKKTDDSFSSTGDTASAIDDTALSSGDTALYDSADSQIDDPITVPDPANFEDCMVAIDAGFSDDDFDTSTLLDCCILTTETVGYDDLHNNPEYEDLNENCCAEIAEQGEWSTACTPWGPPTPPCMRGAANA
ncbi:MAG: hypothetical protein VXZ96_06360 [Myxococcota bacterium]|nr:hypothetical protein [Myxococcota bacterium]